MAFHANVANQIFIPAQAGEILRSAVRWLHSHDGSDWDAVTGHVQFVLCEMRRKASEPIRPAYIGHVPGRNPDAQIFRTIIPFTERMLMAMQRRNREVALEAGNAAIAKVFAC